MTSLYFSPKIHHQNDVTKFFHFQTPPPPPPLLAKSWLRPRLQTRWSSFEIHSQLPRRITEREYILFCHCWLFLFVVVSDFVQMRLNKKYESLIRRPKGQKSLCGFLSRYILKMLEFFICVPYITNAKTKLLNIQCSTVHPSNK